MAELFEQFSQRLVRAAGDCVEGGEGVDHSRVVLGEDVDAGGGEFVGVGQAFVSEWVVVATEEALARGLDGVSKDWIEPVEAMAEAAAVLCDCPSERTGLVRIRRPRSEVTTDSRHLSPRSFRNARRRTAT
jgi:hypothetical protein